MMLAGYASAALASMRQRPLRSALSLVGIFVGVLALVAVLSLREGLQREADDVYRTEGARVLFVAPEYGAVRGRTAALSQDDLWRLRAAPGVLAAEPRAQGERELRAPGQTLQGGLLGVDAGFASVYRVPLVAGRFFLAAEATGRRPVCVLTEKAAARLFPQGGAVGREVTVAGERLIVLGLVGWHERLTERAQSGTEPAVLMPSPAALRQLVSPLAKIEVRLRPDIPLADGLAAVRLALSRGDAGRERFYLLQPLSDLLKESQDSLGQMLTTLLLVTAISLLVGAIGVANVMLASVTERTREIGLRKALGASRRDILFQFLAEACVLTSSAGAAAVAAGALAVELAPALCRFPLPLALPAGPALACVLLTGVVGVLAGVYPASRACSLSAVSALSYE